MGITDHDLEQAYAQHRAHYGGSKEDYFGLLYLTREFDKSAEQLVRHIAFGKDATEGINAFHVDVNRRNLYLFQFQWSKQYQAFREPLRRLAREGMERIFGPALVFERLWEETGCRTVVEKLAGGEILTTYSPYPSRNC